MGDLGGENVCFSAKQHKNHSGVSTFCPLNSPHVSSKLDQGVVFCSPLNKITSAPYVPSHNTSKKPKCPAPIKEEGNENCSLLWLVSKCDWLETLCAHPLQGSNWKEETPLNGKSVKSEKNLNACCNHMSCSRGELFITPKNLRFVLPFQKIKLMT